MIAFGLAGKGDDPSQIADAFVREMKQAYSVDPSRSEPATINGVPAHIVVFSDTSSKQPVHMGFAWIAHKGLVYQYMGVAPEYQREQLSGIVRSFRSMSKQERDSITETRLKIVMSRKGETVDQLSTRTHSVWEPQMAALVNGINVDKQLNEGQLVKIAIQQSYRGE